MGLNIMAYLPLIHSMNRNKQEWRSICFDHARPISRCQCESWHQSIYTPVGHMISLPSFLHPGANPLCNWVVPKRVGNTI